jgi:hypothetical protein
VDGKSSSSDDEVDQGPKIKEEESNDSGQGASSTSHVPPQASVPAQIDPELLSALAGVPSTSVPAYDPNTANAQSFTGLPSVGLPHSSTRESRSFGMRDMPVSAGSALSGQHDATAEHNLLDLLAVPSPGEYRCRVDR